MDAATIVHVFGGMWGVSALRCSLAGKSSVPPIMHGRSVEKSDPNLVKEA